MVETTAADNTVPAEGASEPRLKAYRVAGGVARIGVGDLLGLTAEQIVPRAHNLDVVQLVNARGDAVVRPRIPLDFKVGEVIGLVDLPKYLGDVLVPEAPPESKAERVALAREAERQLAEQKRRDAAGAKRRPRKAAGKAAAAAS